MRTGPGGRFQCRAEALLASAPCTRARLLTAAVRHCIVVPNCCSPVFPRPSPFRRSFGAAGRRAPSLARRRQPQPGAAGVPLFRFDGLRQANRGGPPVQSRITSQTPLPSFTRSALRTSLSLTDANGIVGRGQMHVLSADQVRSRERRRCERSQSVFICSNADMHLSHLFPAAPRPPGANAPVRGLLLASGRRPPQRPRAEQPAAVHQRRGRSRRRRRRRRDGERRWQAAGWGRPIGHWCRGRVGHGPARDPLRRRRRHRGARVCFLCCFLDKSDPSLRFAFSRQSRPAPLSRSAHAGAQPPAPSPR